MEVNYFTILYWFCHTSVFSFELFEVTYSFQQLLESYDKGPYSQSYGFSISHVRMWELDRKEGWAPKNWCFRTKVLEKTLKSLLDSEDIKPVHPKGNQPWIFIRRTDGEAAAPILWPPDVKGQLIGKDSDTGKDWRQEEKGATEDEMVGWHQWLHGLRKLWEIVEDQGTWCDAVHEVTNSRTQLNNWTTK